MSKFKKAACHRCGKVFEYGNGFFDKSPRVEGILFKPICFDCSEKIDKQKVEATSKKRSPTKDPANTYTGTVKSTSDELSKKSAIISLIFFGICSYELLIFMQGGAPTLTNALLIFGSIVCIIIYLILAFSSFLAFLFGLFFAISLIGWHTINHVDSSKSFPIAKPSALDSTNKKIPSHAETPNTTPDVIIENKIIEKTIRELEDEKEYHGDDPIVRQRLGLPPKENP